MSSSNKIPTDGGQSLGQNSFAALDGLSLPSNGAAPQQPAVNLTQKAAPEAPAKNRGRVDILREKAGRGGKTVTVATGFVGIGLPEKEALAKKMQKAAGSGGTVKDGRIEIQGDKREVVARILTEAGFRPVMAGG
ncbi:MAG: translation initiation factor [Nibricoccus sp.]